MRPSLSAALIAVVSALGASACSSRAEEHALSDAPRTVLAKPCATPRSELRDRLRLLFVGRAAWTHFFVVEHLGAMATEPRTVARLLEVDGDIGVALLPYLGAGASRLTSLSREHLRLSGEVLLAAELHDDLRAQAALNALSGHADQIAIFLSDQNPYWLLPEMRSLLGAQDALFVHLVKARLRSDWHDEIRAFDAFSRHALDTADVLTEGIAAQHPTLLTADPVGCGGGPSAAGDELRSRLRSLWLKHVIWGRHVLLSVASSPDMPDLEALRVRLLGSLDDMGIVFRPYFDDASADAFDRLARARRRDRRSLPRRAREGRSGARRRAPRPARERGRARDAGRRRGQDLFGRESARELAPPRLHDRRGAQG